MNWKELLDKMKEDNEQERQEAMKKEPEIVRGLKQWGIFLDTLTPDDLKETFISQPKEERKKLVELMLFYIQDALAIHQTEDVSRTSAGGILLDVMLMNNAGGNLNWIFRHAYREMNWQNHYKLEKTLIDYYESNEHEKMFQSVEENLPDISERLKLLLKHMEKSYED